jgi:hypothetical protein
MLITISGVLFAFVYPCYCHRFRIRIFCMRKYCRSGVFDDYCNPKTNTFTLNWNKRCLNYSQQNSILNPHFLNHFRPNIGSMNIVLKIYTYRVIWNIVYLASRWSNELDYKHMKNLLLISNVHIMDIKIMVKFRIIKLINSVNCGIYQKYFNLWVIIYDRLFHEK